MNSEEKQIVIKIEEIIDIILAQHDSFIIECDVMKKLHNYFEECETFNEDFIRNYISFIEIFNSFFIFLMDKLTIYENSLLDSIDLQSNYFFAFSFNEFEEKDVLIPYKKMLDRLDDMFPNNNLLQGVTLFLHLNSLLNRRRFTNNKIKMINNIPLIEIDYGCRIDYYKEEYITIFRHELEEGIRTSVFIDNDEIIKYIKEEIIELNNGLL